MAAHLAHREPGPIVDEHRAQLVQGAVDQLCPPALVVASTLGIVLVALHHHDQRGRVGLERVGQQAQGVGIAQAGGQRAMENAQLVAALGRAQVEGAHAGGKLLAQVELLGAGIALAHYRVDALKAIACGCIVGTGYRQAAHSGVGAEPRHPVGGKDMTCRNSNKSKCCQVS